MVPQAKFITPLLIIASLCGALVLVFHLNRKPDTASPNESQHASAELPLPESSPLPSIVLSSSTAGNAEPLANSQPPAAATTTAKASAPAPRPRRAGTSTQPQRSAGADTAVNEVAKLQRPYTTPPISLDAANVKARDALVNILCTTAGGGIKPISGSGVFIDPRGIILTNAHVAQYVLLSESANFRLNCTVRTGSPAHAAWKAAVLYIPTVWVDANAANINAVNPTGTGEHDYALLFVTGTADGGPRHDEAFPFLPVDAREEIDVPGDQVLVASYPAELLGGIATESNLYAATSQTTIATLLTFGLGTIDLYSMSDIIEAQSGSSGGAVVNPWGRLIGLIVTMSPGATTAERSLHALTLSYIDRDLAAQTGKGLSNFLGADANISAAFADFYDNHMAPLIQKYYDALPN